MSETKYGKAIVWAVVITALVGTIGMIIYKYQFESSPKTEPAKDVQVPTPKDSSKHYLTEKHSGTQGMKTLMSPPATSNAPQQDGENFQMEGRVVDAKNRSVGVQGVQIKCVNCISTGLVVMTDETGHFKLPYRVKLSGSSQQVNLHLTKGGKTVKVDEPVKKTGVIFAF